MALSKRSVKNLRRYAWFGLMVCSSLLVGCQAFHCRSQNAALKEEDLEQADAGFIYKSQPINPRAIEDLLPWISDSQPGPVTIDLGGTLDSNRYYGDIRREGQRYSIDHDEGFVTYEHLGRLSNGLHVVRVWQNTGGSGIFEYLLLIQFGEDPVYDGEGRRQYRMVMKCRGEVDLFDRYDGKISLKGNSVTIGEDGITLKKPKMISFNSDVGR